ncbi:dolichyl-phosphate-mannose--protein mannosyltransferase [Nakamurella lactea]|uniref:dolichyl-phosphate-mannose--protein mannosyltransferase n=1 Tax=Nakamurella lactea TaxID=459515 RepID=UPI00040A170E|nr:phospholipid carrier-dependent glycosyltransferase [Nakamurella lactea]
MHGSGPGDEHSADPVGNPWDDGTPTERVVSLTKRHEGAEPGAADPSPVAVTALAVLDRPLGDGDGNEDLDGPLLLHRPSARYDDVDERPDRSDVVAVGEVPPLERPVGRRRFRQPAPPTDRLRGWIVTAVITAIGAVVRFWNLGAITDGGTPIFDEKYYALNAYEMTRLGGIEENPAYGLVVHPPLGKQLIAIGEMLFGYNGFGWRFASAVAGTICILLIIRVARRLTGSTLLGGIAGILLICDGVSHVNARVALLDVFQELFVLAAFACLLVDRAQVRDRLARAVAEGAPGLDSPYGIKLGARWWRFGTGLTLGLATSIKWSGIYWIAFFGVMSIIWDILARREAGVRRPVLGTVRRDLLPSLWSYVVIGIGTYIASWWAWFRSVSGWARSNYVADTQDWDSQTLHSIANLWHNTLWQWTWKMLDFHSNLLTPTNPADRHPWESKPWTWPMGTRPVLYYAPADAPAPGCGDGVQNCVRRIFLIGTPMMWWIALFVLGWALWRAIGRLDWRYMAVLVGYGAGYLPWFVNLDRQMYFFYATPFAPFLILGIVLMLGDILGSRRFGVERRMLSLGVVALYVGLVVANFIWLWPILNGVPITPEHLRMETWIPSWG